MEAASVVLVGGRSSRMGRPKAALEWHGSTLLHRTVDVLRRALEGPVVVVRAPGQPLPNLPSGTVVREDPQEGQGPLQGMAVGLAAAGESAGLAFVCSTDLPFLHPVYVERVAGALASAPDVDVVLPHARGHRQPLAAAYRTHLAPLVATLLAQGLRKPAMLFEHCRVHVLDDDALLEDRHLAGADPHLDSLLNINGPDDYERARARPAPEVVVERFGTLAHAGRRGPTRVHAATVAEAAAAVQLPLDRHVVAAINGGHVTRDVHAPLVANDLVAFISPDAGG
jgi:molybdenum cofactor guanylyltransferase